MKELNLTRELIRFLEKQRRNGVEFVALSAETRAGLNPKKAANKNVARQPSTLKQDVEASRHDSATAVKSDLAKADTKRVVRTPQKSRARDIPAPEVVKAETGSAAPVAEPADCTNLSLAELEKMASGCQRCRLGARRRNLVFSDGNPKARLMFIGEGPGREEDEQGKPFVGQAGQLLDRMITAMQFRREDVYIANILKCRPPGNRNPEDDEAQSCLPYLQRQIELVDPEVIVLLGAIPLKYLLGKTGINTLHGRWFEYSGRPVLPTFHPAYLLRMKNKKREAWEDLQKVMLKLGKKPSATKTGNSGD